MQLLLKLKHLPPCHALPLFLIRRLEEVSQNIDQSFLRSSFLCPFLKILISHSSSKQFCLNVLNSNSSEAVFVSISGANTKTWLSSQSSSTKFLCTRLTPGDDDVKLKVFTWSTNTQINKCENRNTQMYEPHLCAASVLPSRWMNRKLPASQTDPLRKRRSNTWLNGKEKFNLNQEAVFIGVASDITTIVAIQGRQESNTLKG